MCPTNLPPIIPGSRSAAPQRPSTSASSLGRRAQDLSVSQLGQHKDRANAKVSMNQVSDARAKSKGQGPAVSIASEGRRNQASVSYSHPTTYTIYEDDAQAQEASDQQRWRHIRRMIKERKKAEKELAGMEHDSSSGGSSTSISSGMKTGKAFRQKGRGTFHKKFSKYVKKHRMKFLSKKDKAFFEDMVTERAKSKRAGQGFSYRDKKQMRSKIDKAYKKGDISKTDKRFFRGEIDSL